MTLGRIGGGLIILLVGLAVAALGLTAAGVLALGVGRFQESVSV